MAMSHLLRLESSSNSSRRVVDLKHIVNRHPVPVLTTTTKLRKRRRKIPTNKKKRKTVPRASTKTKATRSLKEEKPASIRHPVGLESATS